MRAPEDFRRTGILEGRLEQVKIGPDLLVGIRLKEEDDIPETAV
jgi:hypothetical protein